MRLPRVGAWRDVDHHQPLDALGVAAGEQHRRLPAHTVSDQRYPREPRAIQPAPEVVRHRVVAHLGHVRGAAVVARIEGVDVEMRGQIAPGRLPVARRAEQAVQHDHGRTSLAAEVAVEEFDHAAHQAHEARRAKEILTPARDDFLRALRRALGQ